MANIKLHDVFTVAEHWAAVFEYDDRSGLSAEDEAQFDAFCKDLPPAFMCVWGEGGVFTRDAVTGLMATCVELQIYYDADLKPGNLKP